MREYSKEECKNMIKNMCYPVSAPGWVVRAIRQRRKKIDRKTLSPEKELENFLKGSGATGQKL